AKAASSLVVMLFHCWSSTLTVSLAWAFFHSALTPSTTAGGALASISQMVRVRGPVWALDWSPLWAHPPQAATPRTRATARARAAVMRCLRGVDMDVPPCAGAGARSAGRGPAGRGRAAGEAGAARGDGAPRPGASHRPGRAGPGGGVGGPPRGRRRPRPR